MGKDRERAAVGTTQHPPPVRRHRGDQQLVIALDGRDHLRRRIAPQPRSPLQIGGDDRDHDPGVGGWPTISCRGDLPARCLAGEQGRFLRQNGALERR